MNRKARLAQLYLEKGDMRPLPALLADLVGEGEPLPPELREVAATILRRGKLPTRGRPRGRSTEARDAAIAHDFIYEREEMGRPYEEVLAELAAKYNKSEKQVQTSTTAVNKWIDEGKFFADPVEEEISYLEYVLASSALQQ